MIQNKFQGEVLSEDKFYGGAAVVLSKRKKVEREKPLSYCQEWVFLTYSNENHFERIKEFFCFHSTKNETPVSSL